MSVDVVILDQIKKILGDQGFISDKTQMQPYLTSWRNNWTGKSPLITFPESTAQVSEIVKICAQHNIALVPQGGNTGLVGGSIPSSDGTQIVLNLSRMNKIRELDAVGSTITVEAGVVLGALQDIMAQNNFLFPLNMGSEGSAEIGGAISTNAGGTAVLRYGNMRDLVLGVEAVLPDGQIYSGLTKLIKDNAGYDMTQIFIGAEGTLGIITAASLKLFPALNQKLTAIIAIKNPALALELLNDFRKKACEYLNAFEIISHHALMLVLKHISGTRFPGKIEAPYYLLVELSSSSQLVALRDVFEEIASEALEQEKILDAVISESTAHAKQFWRLREEISEAIRKEGQGIYFDISLPLDQIANFLEEIAAKIKIIAPTISLAPFGHIGDGNLHYNMFFLTPQDAMQFLNLKKKIQDVVYSEVRKRQGSISAEHGIGIDRKAELLATKTPLDMSLMKAIKRALDPKNLMNPAKIFD